MNLELKKACIAHFENRLIDNIWVHYIIDERNMNDQLCIYDSDENIAIDINTGNCYQVLQRNFHGQLESSQYDKIKLNENYALDIQRINWNHYTRSQKIAIMLNYYKTLMQIRCHVIDYTEQNRKWNEREAWKSNYMNETKKEGKVLNFTNNTRK